MHPHLDGLEGTERDIREKLGRRAGRQVQRRLPLLRLLRPYKITVEFLEEFIPTILEGTLGLDCVSMQRCVRVSEYTHRVAKESRAPTGEDPTQALCAVDLGPAFEIALVEVGIDLASTFDQVQRRYRRVG